jgi:hypothetical protein
MNDQHRLLELDGNTIQLVELDGLLLGQLWQLDLRVDDGQIGLPTIVIIVVEEESLSGYLLALALVVVVVEERSRSTHQGVKVGHIPPVNPLGVMGRIPTSRTCPVVAIQRGRNYHIIYFEN